MATAKPKRMMFGGVAKGAMNSVKKAVAAKSAPMKMQNAARSAAQQAAPKQMQFMSDKLRGAPVKPAPMPVRKAAPMPVRKAAPMPVKRAAPVVGFPGGPGGKTTYSNDRPVAGKMLKPAPTTGTIGTTGFKPGAKASFDSSIFGRKKGGVIKKATKK
jgi:hypothetical protein